MASSVERQPTANQIGVYECEVKLKFRIIEEKLSMRDREQLLQTLIDAVAYGNDEYLESLQTKIDVKEIQEVEASPEMRRQLIRLRNSGS